MAKTLQVATDYLETSCTYNVCPKSHCPELTLNKTSHEEFSSHTPNCSSQNPSCKDSESTS